jgi:hypothetical protein
VVETQHCHITMWGCARVVEIRYHHVKQSTSNPLNKHRAREIKLLTSLTTLFIQHSLKKKLKYLKTNKLKKEKRKIHCTQKHKQFLRVVFPLKESNVYSMCHLKKSNFYSMCC